MKVAVVCSWLNQYGGAERVLEAVHSVFPEAPVFTSLFQPEALSNAFTDWDVRPSFLNRIPGACSHHQWLLPLYPSAVERFDLSGYDLILSVTSAFAHGVTAAPGALHICYCLTPARFLWDYDAYVAREGLSPLVKRVLPMFVARLRHWDREAAQRVDHFVAISQTVQQRIRAHYARESQIIYPPVDIERFLPSNRHDDYYLITSRLVPYKRIDLAVKAFSALGLPLWIIGEGRDRKSLEAMAGPSVRFLGWVSDDEMASYMAHCRAFVFPGEEDFGIAPLEAQASGRPVIAYAAGGALDTVVEGRTGLFFRRATPESLAAAVTSFNDAAFDPVAIRKHALAFERREFERRFENYVHEKYAQFAARGKA